MTHRLVELLELESNIEGGFYRQLYKAEKDIATDSGQRSLATTIYYLLTADSPVGYLHRNSSDITHFLHSGGPVSYIMLTPEGELVEKVLGWDLLAGQQLSFTCPGGWWKSSHLPPDVDHCLISEIVAPAFCYDDHSMATVEEIETDYPELVDALRNLIAT